MKPLTNGSLALANDELVKIVVTHVKEYEERHPEVSGWTPLPSVGIHGPAASHALNFSGTFHLKKGSRSGPECGAALPRSHTRYA